MALLAPLRGEEVAVPVERGREVASSQDVARLVASTRSTSFPVHASRRVITTRVLPIPVVVITIPQ
jgi:hypothetical protein